MGITRGFHKDTVGNRTIFIMSEHVFDVHVLTILKLFEDTYLTSDIIIVGERFACHFLKAGSKTHTPILLCVEERS